MGKALFVSLPAAMVAALLVLSRPSSTLCNVVCQLAAAYALGSNIWLIMYGKKTFKVCTSQSTWLGKESFSTIQAASFPDFFAFLTAASFLACGGYVGSVEDVDERLVALSGLAAF